MTVDASDLTNWQVNGDATTETVDGALEIVLTAATGSQNGNAFLTDTVLDSIDGVTVEITTKSDPGGADGFCIFFADADEVAETDVATNGEGGGRGMGGFSAIGFGIEEFGSAFVCTCSSTEGGSIFDNNNVPQSNAAITGEHVWAVTWIVDIPGTYLLQASLDGVPVIDLVDDGGSELSFDATHFRLGVSAGTGGAFAQHAVTAASLTIPALTFISFPARRLAL